MVVLWNKIVRVFSLSFSRKIPITCLRRLHAGGIKGIHCLSFLCLKCQKVLLFPGFPGNSFSQLLGLAFLWTKELIREQAHRHQRLWNRGAAELLLLLSDIGVCQILGHRKYSWAPEILITKFYIAHATNVHSPDLCYSPARVCLRWQQGGSFGTTHFHVSLALWVFWNLPPTWAFSNLTEAFRLISPGISKQWTLHI